jgi:hypothetical protein
VPLEPVEAVERALDTQGGLAALDQVEVARHQDRPQQHRDVGRRRVSRARRRAQLAVDRIGR